MKTLITIIGTFICCGLFAQEIPQKISYQGKLLQNGSPVNGNKNITFTIGSWSENHPNVLIEDGLYSVTLGQNYPLPVSLFNNSSTLQLQINVAGTNLTPLTDLLSVPYAFKTEEAVNCKKIAGNPVIGSPSLNQVLKWNGTEWQPQNDGLSLPYSELSYNAGTTAFLIHNTGTSGHVAEFEIDNPSHTSTLLNLQTNGSGEAITIYNDGSNDAIQINNNSNSGVGINIDNDGWHDAMYINNSSNSQFGIWLKNYSSYEALQVENYGDEHSANIRIINPSNDQNALNAYTDGTGYAGRFFGNVSITGSCTKASGTFKIDHPLDPENKYLYHSFVESPDMMNVYNGNIILNESGEAIVLLPDWFEALNTDFRYQLTCIGAFAQVFIADEIHNNKFRIAGGAPNLKISWQVTGIRKDPWANEHRVIVEEDKTPKEQGHYLHYKEYNQPFEKSITAIENPDLIDNSLKTK